MTPTHTLTPTASPRPTNTPSATATILPTATSTTSTGQVLTESSLINAGWNLVGFAVTPPSNRIPDVLSSLSGRYDIVFGFDPTSGVQSYFTDPNKALLNNLTAMTPLSGYWVHALGGGTLTVTGTARTIAPVTLSSGWNLVAYGGSTPAPVGTVLGPLSGRAVVVFGFDAAAGGALSYFADPRLASLNNLSAFTPFAGYWIYLTPGGPLTWAGHD